MNKETKRKINALALLFYKSLGYQVENGYDFSEARHPQERGMWNQSIIAWAVLKEDNSVLEYQV